MAYTRTSTHKECTYFNNGFCMLNNMPIDPDQAGCPNFTPKGVIPIPKPAPSYQQTWQQGIAGFKGVGRGMGTGRGMGMGRGGGRGMGQFTPQTFPQTPAGAPAMPTPPASKDQEIQMVENQVAALQQQLEQVKKRMRELE